MLGMAEIVENQSVNIYICKQLKKIKKNKVNASSILIKLGNQLSKEFNFTFTSDEMLIKVDRKHNINEVKVKVISLLKDLLPSDIDIRFIFKIIPNEYGLSLRIKRNI